MRVSSFTTDLQSFIHIFFNLSHLIVAGESVAEKSEDLREQAAEAGQKTSEWENEVKFCEVTFFNSRILQRKSWRLVWRRHGRLASKLVGFISKNILFIFFVFRRESW
jgi:hypothetical protein